MASAGPTFLADEMLGRLARYLRFLGYDTAYARGLSDAEVLRQAHVERRLLLTRDLELAGRSERSLLLHQVDVLGQLREIRLGLPSLRNEPTFDRCPECNTPLLKVAGADLSSGREVVPPDLLSRGATLYRCPDCRRRYWEGSHTDRLRERLRTARGDAP